MRKARYSGELLSGALLRCATRRRAAPVRSSAARCSDAPLTGAPLRCAHQRRASPVRYSPARCSGDLILQ